METDRKEATAIAVVLQKSWDMQIDDLRLLHGLLEKMIVIKEACRLTLTEATPSSQPPAKNHATSGSPKRGRATIVRRRPMRAPRPGSLRDAVHAALRQSTDPMSRQQIIQKVAASRRAIPDQKLSNAISEVLRQPHDTFVKRTESGDYVYCSPRT